MAKIKVLIRFCFIWNIISHFDDFKAIDKNVKCVHNIFYSVEIKNLKQ